MECRAYGICLDSQSRGYLGKDRKVSSAAGGNLSRMHKTQETAKESRLNFMYSHLRNRTLVRSLHPSSLGKRRFLRDATRTWPQNTDKRRLAYGSLPHKTGRLPSARSGHHAWRIVARTRNHPNRRARMTKRDRLQPLAQRHFVPAPARELVRQSASQQTSCQ